MFYNSFDNIGLLKVLSLLKSHSTEYLSGQDLSDVLKISRVAIWKHIRTIKELGYQVQTKQKSGYRLAKGTERLLPWEVTAGLDTQRIGRKAYYFDETDSTQNYAAELAKLKDKDGSVVIAERQTHGRGRLERRWESPDGGIWLSVVSRPKVDHTTLSLIPIAAGVALAGAIKKSSSIDSQLKWPNDVTIDSKKVAGIVIDAAVESNRLEYVVIGVGVNFDTDTKKIEKALKGTANFYGITSIASHSQSAAKLEIVQKFLEELEKNMNLLEGGRADAVIRDWTRHSGTIGKTVTTVIDGEKIRGVAQKIDGDGALVIKTPKGARRVLAEDVAHLR